MFALVLTLVVQTHSDAARGSQGHECKRLAHLHLRGGAGWREKRLQKMPRQPVALEPPMGTRDFYPDDMRRRAWLFDHFRTVSRLFGFIEYDAPVLEHQALYTRKGGEEITAQMYAFVDKGGYNVTLRPELTPSLARMVLAREKELLLPLKWYGIAQCWRFENVQVSFHRS